MAGTHMPHNARPPSPPPALGPARPRPRPPSLPCPSSSSGRDRGDRTCVLQAHARLDRRAHCPRLVGNHVSEFRSLLLTLRGPDPALFGSMRADCLGARSLCCSQKENKRLKAEYQQQHPFPPGLHDIVVRPPSASMQTRAGKGHAHGDLRGQGYMCGPCTSTRVRPAIASCMHLIALLRPRDYNFGLLIPPFSLSPAYVRMNYGWMRLNRRTTGCGRASSPSI